MNKTLKKWLIRTRTSVKFSAIIGVSYWATTIYEQAFAQGSWLMAIKAFAIVAVVLLVFGSSLLDSMEND